MSWLLNHATKIASFFYLGLLLFIPSQFGYHFWPAFSVLSGLRIDYLSPTLYFSDMFLLGLFIFLLPRLYQELLSPRRRLFALSFLGYLLITSLFSLSPLNSLYGLVRWFGIALVLFSTQFFWQERQMVKKSMLVISVGVIYTTGLLGAQFLLQHSVGGVFYFLGERTFSGMTPGIANASLNGTLILRPYASFPHPNVAAGYLLVSLLLLWTFRNTLVRHWQKMLMYFALVAATGGILLTLSRSAIIVLAIVLLSFLISRVRLEQMKIWQILSSILLFCVLSVVLLPRFLTLSLTNEAVALRLILLERSFEILRQHPFFGVGLKNFLLSLSTFPPTSLSFSSLQPVHSLFALIIVETGLFSLLWIVPLIRILYHRVVKATGDMKFLKISLFCYLLLIGSVDHYLYTLWQGQLLFGLVLGILWLKKDPFFTKEAGFTFQKKQISRKRLRKASQQ